MASYDRQTALIVVDVQNDFADPQGSLYVPDGEAVVGVINEEIGKAQEDGVDGRPTSEKAEKNRPMDPPA